MGYDGLLLRLVNDRVGIWIGSLLQQDHMQGGVLWSGEWTEWMLVLILTEFGMSAEVDNSRF